MNEHTAREYDALKQELAQRFPDDRESYTAAKGEFIQGAYFLLPNQVP